MKIRIVENSFRARIAARLMKATAIAIVFGKGIHLWNISRKEFLQNRSLVAHELAHVRQYQRYGYLPFCVLYLWESARKGYYNNRFEVEARSAERKAADLTEIEFV